MNLHKFVVVTKDPDTQRLAQRYGEGVFGADDPTEAIDIIRTVEPDFVLYDYRFGPDQIRKLLNQAAGKTATVPNSYKPGLMDICRGAKTTIGWSKL